MSYLQTLFHVKHNAPARPCRLALLPSLLFVVLLTGTACAAVRGADGWAQPVSIPGANVLIVQTDSGVISALQLSDGNAIELWRYPGDDDDIDLDAVYARPIIDGDTLYVASYNGDIVALNLRESEQRRTAVVRWGPTDVGDHIVATPAYRNGSLYVATEAGDVIIVDAESGGVGETLLDSSDRIWAALTVDSSRIYVATLNGQLRAIDRSGNEVRWGLDVGAVGGDPQIDGDLLFVPSFDRKLHALDLTTPDGNEVWAASGDAWFWARPLPVGDTVYAATVGGSVYAFDRNTGNERWRFHDADSEFRTVPVLAGGVLVIASFSGDLFGIDPTTGNQLWTRSIDGARFLADPLVLQSGDIAYVDNDGKLRQVTPSTGDIRLLFEPQ